MQISARLVVNRAAFKMRSGEIVPLVEAFRKAVEVRDAAETYRPLPYKGGETMNLRLSTRDAGFDAAFNAPVDASREADADVSQAVPVILKRQPAGGDAAARK